MPVYASGRFIIRGFLLIGKIHFLSGGSEIITETTRGLTGIHSINSILRRAYMDADSGRLYGTLCNVSQTGANDVYHVRFSNGKEQLIPAIPQVVLEINPQEEKMLIRPLEGLFENDEI